MWTVKNKRVDYKASELRRKDLVESPVEMFRIWFDQVEGIHPFESTAMTLSTTNKDGKPSSRVVLLKGYDEDGFVFYTNYESRKGREIEENPIWLPEFLLAKSGKAGQDKWEIKEGFTFTI